MESESLIIKPNSHAQIYENAVNESEISSKNIMGSMHINSSYW